MATKTLSPSQSEELLSILKARFEKYTHRHEGIAWADVHAKLQGKAEALWSLNEMEITGGDPDVIGLDENTGEIIFYDCAPETPKNRRSICYDHQALEARKEHKPANSAVNMAEEMGVTLLTEDQYQYLQTLGEFDLKTSSWLTAPADVRKLGGAIFGDRRYKRVFIYHNGAESYYAGRGFRGSLRV